MHIIDYTKGPLTGREHGLSRTTRSSDRWITSIGLDNTGVSCLQNFCSKSNSCFDYSLICRAYERSNRIRIFNYVYVCLSLNPVQPLTLMHWTWFRIGCVFLLVIRMYLFVVLALVLFFDRILFFVPFLQCPK